MQRTIDSLTFIARCVRVDDTSAAPEINVAVAWLIIAYGPKPKGSIANAEAAQTQLRLLQDLHKRSGSDQPLWVRWDYARKVTRLSDLPVPAELLATTRANGGAILIASVQKIMAASPPEHRSDLMAELEAHGDLLCIADLGGRRFDRVAGTVKQTLGAAGLDLVRMKGKSSGSTSSARRSERTAAGRAASMAVRSETAANSDAEIAAVRARLLRDHGTVTNAMIANAANASGLRTSRGGLWGRDTVRRVLKRWEAVRSTPPGSPPE